MKDITTEVAIERIHDLIRTCDVGIEKYGAYDDLFALDKQALEKVLNELENYNEGNIVSLKLLEKYYLISKNKGKQSFVDEEFFKEYIPKEVVEEKDMIIDAMAQYIDNLNYIDDIECEFETRHNLK